MTRSAGTFRKTPTESEPLGFDFAVDLATGETISTAPFTMAVVEGTDASPSSMLSGSPAISGTEVRQRVVGGVVGVTYELSCTITTSMSNTKKACAYVVVEDC